MNKKGFSLVELIATVTIIGILGGMSIMAVTRSIVNSQAKTYKNYENQMIGAAKNYLTTHTDDLEVNSATPQKLTLKTLQDNGYIENLVDPKSKHNCDAEKSYVEVVATQNAGAFNVNFQYAACLCCTDASYQTYDSKKDSSFQRSKNRCQACW